MRPEMSVAAAAMRKMICREVISVSVVAVE
jgi:hypothetical protein